MILKQLYGKELNLISDSNKRKVFYIENESGYGEIILYDLFDGIQAIFNNMHLEYCNVCNNKLSNIVEINHCYVGRCECEFNEKKCLYMSEGDLSIESLKSLKSNRAFFPLSHYHGITILIDLKKIENYELFRIFGINLNIISKIANDDKQYRIIRANRELEHIFYEFYHAEEEFKIDYLRVKVIELMLFLSKINWELGVERQSYLTQHHVNNIKNIKKFIIKDITAHYTIDDLSEKFNISSTALKNNFKEIYGTSIYNYLKVYRLQQSIKYLKEGEKSVAEIANTIGYANPAKYSSAFKKEYEISPLGFRKKYLNG